MANRPTTDQIIMGINTVKEVLVHKPEKILSIFIEKKGERGDPIKQLCQKLHIPMHYMNFDQISHLTGSDSHQGVAAHIQTREFLHLKEFFEKTKDQEKVCVLMLDQIFDPQNVGAILRAAECFGVDAVIFSKNRGAKITPTVTKVSCGASELLPLVSVANLAETVVQFQKEGYKAVVSLLDPRARPLSQYQFADKTLLIVGSEGEGVQKLIQKRADDAVYIPMKGHIQSLNVAQATAILLNQVRGFS